MFAELPIDEWEQVRAGLRPAARSSTRASVSVAARWRRRGASSSGSRRWRRRRLQEQSAYQCAHARLLLAEGDSARRSPRGARVRRSTPTSASARRPSRSRSSSRARRRSGSATATGSRSCWPQIEALPLGQRSAVPAGAHVCASAPAWPSATIPAVAGRGSPRRWRCSARSGWCSTWPSSSSSSPSSSLPSGRADECEPLAAEAREIFERLARGALARARRRARRRRRHGRLNAFRRAEGRAAWALRRPASPHKRATRR